MLNQIFRSIKSGVALIALLMIVPFVIQAQSPVVYGIFFYSPTCPHCHEVINNHWPGIQTEFGDQLQVLFIDVTTRNGSQLMGTTVTAMNIPSTGVPMLIIGSEVLIGSVDIPERAPDIIRNGLNAGGIGYPPIPGIEVIFQSALPDAPSATNAVEQISLTDDPANFVALIVLVGLIAVIATMLVAGWSLIMRRDRTLIGRIGGLFGQRMALIGTLIGMGLAASLVIGSFKDPIITLISVLVLVGFGILTLYLFQSSTMSESQNWLIPVAALIGFLVAAYLAYVGTTLAEATCGLLGNCNTVQQSSYARIAGIPIGVIGVVGYLVMLGLWVLNRTQRRLVMDVALFVLAILGVGFSTYLTFLEPFVIGASCVWCLISAVVMGVLLWMTAPDGWNALYAMRYPHEA